MSLNYQINTRTKAEAALRRLRQGDLTEGGNELMPAVVVAANGDGYDVATVDDQGNMGRLYERLFTYPGGATLAEEQEIWLWMPADGETPIILVSGGGGGCSRFASEWGVLFS